MSRCLHRQGGGSAHDCQGKALHLFDTAAPGPSYAPAAAPTSGRRYPSPTARSPAGPGVHTELPGQAEGEDGARVVTYAGWRSTATVRTTPAGPRATRSTRTAASGLPSPDWRARRPVVADVSTKSFRSVIRVASSKFNGGFEQVQRGVVDGRASNTRCHGDPQSAVGRVSDTLHIVGHRTIFWAESERKPDEPREVPVRAPAGSSGCDGDLRAVLGCAGVADGQDLGRPSGELDQVGDDTKPAMSSAASNPCGASRRWAQELPGAWTRVR